MLRLRVMLAVLVALMTAGTALATAPTLTFSGSSGCTLEGWTTTGDVTVYKGAYNNCWANLNASTDGAAAGQTVTAQMEAFIQVPSTTGMLSLNIRVIAESSGGSADYPAQTISIYNQQGTRVYHQPRNHRHSDNEAGFLSAGMSMALLKGQTIRVVFSTQVTSADPASPAWSRLKVDRLLFYNPLIKDGSPETMPGGGW